MNSLFRAQDGEADDPIFGLDGAAVRLFLTVAVFAIGLLLLTAPSPAHAQYICPNGPGPGENQVGTTPGGNGVAPMPLCAPVDGGGSGNGPYVPRYVHVDTSAAMAWHPDVGDVWLNGAALSEDAAKRNVLAACTAAMGSGCSVAVTFSEAAVGVARDSSGSLVYAMDGISNEAGKRALEACSARQVMPCELMITFNSYDHDHNPDLKRYRKSYAAAAWETGNETEALYVASGYSDLESAQSRAISACQAAMPGKTCEVTTWVGNGFVVPYLVDRDGRAVSVEHTVERAELRASKVCNQQHATSCRVQEPIDSRQRGLFVHDYSTGRHRIIQ